jgi:Transcription elongation factor, GreA/GreB, C-term
MSVPAIGEERVLITAAGTSSAAASSPVCETRSADGSASFYARLAAAATSMTTPRSSGCSMSRRSSSGELRPSKAQLAAAEVAPPPSDGRAGIGSLVRVRELTTGGDVVDYELVGPLEGDPMNGHVSIAAPIGRSLIGQRRGARVEVATPRGTVALEVVKVWPAPSAIAKNAA